MRTYSLPEFLSRRSKRCISIFTTSTIPEMSKSAPPRSSLRNSNIFHNRMLLRCRLLRLLLAGIAGGCLAHSVCALDPARTISQYVHEQFGTDRGFLGGTVYAI